MIKGITLIRAVPSSDAFDQLSSLLGALGFEPGKGWADATGRGAAFLAPIGNLELVTGRAPAVPETLIEVTQLDHVHAAVQRWMLTHHRTEDAAARLSPMQETHWNSRLFTVQLSADAADTIGFWQSENPFHGQHPAIEGDLTAVGMKFALVTARWNAVITDRLLQGSLDALLRSGAAKDDIQIVRVPGAWEVPNAARTLADTGKYDAIITLGCLIRGETAHYEAIYNEVARGIGQSQQDTGIPHAFGVLTCETLEQALDRAGVKAGNKGFEAAIAAIEMVSIQRKIGAKKLMGTRRKSRELTMQMLFQGDLGKQTPDQVRKLFWTSRDDVDDETRAFAEDLYRIATVREDEIDDLIQAHAQNWRIERMPVVDRNLLRAATAEMLGFPNTPGPIIINETLEVARRYAAPESIHFLNGVLDAIGKAVLKARLA